MEKVFDFTGVVLAGGMGTRMGADKGLVLFKGLPLVEYALEAFKANRIERIFLSANNVEYQKFGVPVIKDEVEKVGPIGGLFSALNVVTEGYVIVMPCDTPNIPHYLIRLLMDSVGEADACIPIHADGKTEPLLACYHSRILPVLMQQIKNKDYKLQNLFSKISIRHVDVLPEWDLRNLNTRDELRIMDKER